MFGHNFSRVYSVCSWLTPGVAEPGDGQCDFSHQFFPCCTFDLQIFLSLNNGNFGFLPYTPMSSHLLLSGIVILPSALESSRWHVYIRWCRVCFSVPSRMPSSFFHVVTNGISSSFLKAEYCFFPKSILCVCICMNICHMCAHACACVGTC